MLKTMAVEITEDNYDVAAACLRAGFAANWPKSQTLGSILIINDLRSITADDKKPSPATPPMLVVQNHWMSRERFDAYYKFIDPKQKGKTFAEVELID